MPLAGASFLSYAFSLQQICDGLNQLRKPSGRKSAPSQKVDSAKDAKLDAFEKIGEATVEEYYDDGDSIFEDDIENADEPTT